MRKYRLTFEELVPDGECKGSVLKIYNIDFKDTYEGIEYHEEKDILQRFLNNFVEDCMTYWQRREKEKENEGN